jgi:hypothetical protein
MEEIRPRGQTATSVYRAHVEKITGLVNQLLDAILEYRGLLDGELEEAGGRRGYQWTRLRKRAIGEIDDVVAPVENVVLDRVIRLVDRVMTLEIPDNDRDFV